MPTILLWSLCLWGTLSAQGIAYSDLHHSALYSLYYAEDWSSLGDTTAAFNIPELEALQGGLIFLSLGFPEYDTRKGQRPRTIEGVLQFFREFKAYCKANYPQITFVQDKNSLQEALSNGKIACALAMEGTDLLEDNINYLDSLHTEGLSMLGLGHWFANDFMLAKDSIAQKKGIARINAQTRWSPQGKVLIEKLIEHGILIDVSHLGQRLFRELVAQTRGRSKLIASHANAYAICRHTRNLKPWQIREILRSGGLIGICLHQPILHHTAPADQRYVLEHIHYFYKKYGSQNFAIGSDWLGNTRPPAELERPKQLSIFAKKMAASGWDAAFINRFFTTNVLQIWD